MLLRNNNEIFSISTIFKRDKYIFYEDIIYEISDSMKYRLNAGIVLLAHAKRALRKLLSVEFSYL